MRRTLSTIALAVLTVGLLGSCSKINERLDNLDKRIDGIENEKIATITGQIDGIKSSIEDLGQIRSDISNLKQSAESHGQDIFALQEADETLGNRIDNLEDYLENVLPNYAEKEWMKATFSTLEQYDSTCTAIAEINVKIGELDTKLSKDIETSEGKLTKALNDAIAKVNDRIDALNIQVTNLNNAVIDLAGRVNALDTMIQSVTIVPAYSDGSVEVKNDSLIVDFIVSPASVVANLKKDSVIILVNKVMTKAVAIDTIKVAEEKDFGKDTANGTVSVKVKIADYIPTADDSALTVAVNVRNGISNYTAKFVPVYVPTPYVEITAKYDGEANPYRTLKWYRQNLAITTSGNKKWKGYNTSSTVKVPGTNDDVKVGDYFQWAASYEGYDVTENKKPDSLLIYTSFTNKYCVDGGSKNEFTFRSAGDGKPYQFKTSNENKNVGISPYYSDASYTKYTSSSLNLEESDDVASIILGDNWRMPTSAEFTAMKEATYWAWDEMDYGFYVFEPDESHNAGAVAGSIPEGWDKSDALLFFPAAGHGKGTDLIGAGVNGFYLSSTLAFEQGVENACYLYYRVDYWGLSVQMTYYERYRGYSVRPVSDK